MLVNRTQDRTFAPTDYPGIERSLFRHNPAGGRTSVVRLDYLYTTPGEEHDVMALSDALIHWSWPLAAALAYVAIGPAIIAFRCWGAGVQQAGPAVASFFVNLTPLFTALLSSMILGESPKTYHAMAFILIVGGIVISAGRATARR